MPRTRRSQQQPPPEPPNSLIASAARASKTGTIKRPPSGVQEWQRELWYFYDTCGEFRYGVSWRAACCSRARLTITESGPEGDTLITEGPEVEALQALFGGEAGQSQALAQIALHFDVPGETYIVGETTQPTMTSPDEEPEEVDRWTIYSNEEITRERRKSAPWVIDRGDGKKREIKPDDPGVFVMRLWDSHPRKWVEANSPGRAVLPVLRELEGLTKHVASTIDSRLGGAGILAIPSEMTFSAPPPVIDPENPDAPLPPPAEDPFFEMLTETILTAIANRESAAAAVPVLIRAPGAFIGNIKHLTFSTPLDEKALELRKECIRRLALGLDMPPEVLLGLSDSNHWSAWQIDEAALKTHVEPLLEKITTGLTERWLEAALGSAFNPRRRINFDTSELRLRPDRSSEAVQLYDRFEIGGDTLRRETGFDEGDGPDIAERKAMMLTKLAVGAVTPEIAAAALAALGATLALPPAPEPADDTPPPAPAPEPAADEPANNRDAPDETQQPEAVAASAAIVACADLIAVRAIERAWNRVGRRARTRRPISDEQLDAALVDAWEHVPRVAATLSVPAEWMRDGLDRYVRGVLRSGEEHSLTVMAQVLDRTPEKVA